MLQNILCNKLDLFQVTCSKIFRFDYKLSLAASTPFIYLKTSRERERERKVFRNDM